MTKSGLSKSARKFVRTQKALIRKQFLDINKQKEAISQLYDKFISKAEESIGEAAEEKVIKKSKQATKETTKNKRQKTETIIRKSIKKPKNEEK